MKVSEKQQVKMFVESTTGAYGGSNFSLQQLLQVLDKRDEEKQQKQKEKDRLNQQKQEKDKAEIVRALSETIKENQQKLEENLEQNQRKLEQKQKQISEEIKVHVVEINKVEKEYDKKFEKLLENAFSSKPETETNLDSKDTVEEEEEEEEDKLQRRLWESNIELGQLTPISGTQTVAEIIKEVVGTDESAASTQGKDDATMEADSCISVDPAVKVNDVILVSNEITTATSNEIPLYQCIPFHTITLASITLSDELRLILWSSDVRLKVNSQHCDVCVRRKDSRFPMPIQQSPVFSSSSGKQTCNLQPRVQMQTVPGLISRVLTTGDLGARDNQLQAVIRNHLVVKTKKEMKEIAATQTIQFETDATRTTATSISRNNFKEYKSRHKLKVKRLSEQYCAVMELQVLFKGTKCVHLWLGMWSYSLVAEHETHCVGPGLTGPTSSDPTSAYSQNT
jgi:hypothetical protein